MKTGLEIATLLVVALGWGVLVWRARPRRDVCQPLTNEERLLAYIERRAAWECERRKQKLLQRQRVERLLEQRWLTRNASHTPTRSGPTVPRPLVSEAA